MTIMDQIHAEAARVADSQALEIIEAAQKALVHTRFQRLRKRTTLPQDTDERDYVHALNEYVRLKLLIRKRLGGQVIHTAEDLYLRREMEFHRERMDRIEFGYTLRSYLASGIDKELLPPPSPYSPILTGTGSGTKLTPYYQMIYKYEAGEEV